MKFDIGIGHPRVLSRGRLRIPVFIDFNDAPESMHITVVINDHGDKTANEAAAMTRAKVLARQLEGGEPA